MSKKQLYGIFAALTANLIFGFSFIFSKLALTAAHPLIILAVRFTAAFIVMNLLVITGRVKISFRGKKLHRLILMGVAQPLLYFIFELYGLSLVSSALSGVIIALVPVVVMLLAAVFLNERPSLIQSLCTVVSIVGVAVISVLPGGGGKTHFIGILLLLSAVVTAAVFNILSRNQAKSFTAFERTYVMFFIGCIGFNIIAVSVLRTKYIPCLISAFTSTDFLIAILYLAVVSSVAAFLLYNYSTSVISVIQSSSFSNIITVVSVLAGVFILKERFSAAEFALCLLIILGVWGVNAFPKKTNNK